MSVLRRTLLGLALLAGLVCSLARAAVPAGLEPAVTAADVDWDHCVAWGDGHELGPAPREALAALLGLAPATAANAGWTTAPLAGEVRHFRVAFRKPVAVGTICTDYAGDNAVVAILRPDAAAPGALTADAEWQALPQGTVKTLPAGTMVRALRCTQFSRNLPWEETRRPAQMARLLLLKGRFWDPAALGGSEWSRPAPGRDVWLGYWPRSLTVAGVAVLRRSENAAWAIPPPASDEHPAALEPSAWQALPFSPGSNAGIGVLVPTTPVTTRGLRFTAKDYRREANDLAAVMPLVALADHEAPPTSFLPPAPFTFPYTMPLPGFMAIRVSDKPGHDVRRLVAEVERPAGAVQEPWNLRDDDGGYVKPGTYQWRGLARPPLKLTYEMTVYNAGHPPWRAPVQGGGGWMADHSPPVAVCAVGEHMFMGALGSEFGVPLIATDLEGRKVWHTESPSSAQRLVSDGRCAYVVNNDALWRIDPARGFAATRLLTFQYSPELPGHADGYYVAERSGAACRGNLLAIAYNAPEAPWITSAFRAGEVDLARCFPPPTGEKVHETAYTPAERILGAFLAITSSQQAGFGKAADKGPLAHTLLLTLTREVPIGSVLLPDREVQVWALRPGKALPAAFNAATGPGAGAGAGREGLETGGKPEDDTLGLGEDTDARFTDDTWVRLTPPAATAEQRNAPAVAVPEKGLATRVLAFTGPKLSQLEYALVLNRRYRNAAADASLLLGEGEASATGGWRIHRPPQKPITAGSTPMAALVWNHPVAARGFALLRPIPWAAYAVDVWDGPADATITADTLRTGTHWREVYVHRQTTNHMKMNWHFDRVLYGDFGAVLNLHALRVRVIEHPHPPATPPVSADGGFDGLVVFQPLGAGDPELPPQLAQRVTLVDLPPADGTTAGIRRHIPLPAPGALAFDAAGNLYAATGNGVVRIPQAALQGTGAVTPQPVLTLEQVRSPRAMLFDRAGQFYVLDRETQTVQVFDPQSGKHLRTLGTPGGPRLGPWDPTRLSEPVSMALDTHDKLWIVEQSFQPKRIGRWALDGTFEKDFMGPTHYGGGGFMDPGDRTVVNHLGMKFRIDYQARTWKLESRLCFYNSRGMFTPDRVLYHNGRRYLVGDREVVTPFGDSGPTMVICEEKNGVAVPLAAAGLLSGWSQFGTNAEALNAFRDLEGGRTSFVWSDLNRDGVAQAAEVQVRRDPAFTSSAGVGDDLSLNFTSAGTGWRLRPATVRADGLPVYDLKTLTEVKELTGPALVNAAGESFVMGHKFLDRDGKVLWTYPDRYFSVQQSYLTPWGFYNRPPGVLCGGLWPLAQFRVGQEELFCVNGNNGDYYAFTRDGLLAAAVLGGPNGYGRRFFSIPDCEPGKTDLSDLRKTVEDFHGHICRADDGNVYCIAGKNHVTVIRVDGLERMQRLSGTFQVTAEDVRRAMAWATVRAQAERALVRPQIAVVPYVSQPPAIDGDIRSDWPQTPPLEIHITRNQQNQVLESWTANLAFDREHLYVAARGLDDSPMVNGAADRQRLFQGGDGVDLQLGVDPAADAARTEPVPGDLRLVLSSVGGKPVAMLYRYRVAGAKPDAGRRFTSPVGETQVDEIRDITDAVKIAVARQAAGGRSTWTLEAAIPWRAIGGGDIGKSVRLRGDIGALVSDPAGLTTTVRYYWANRSQVVMSDLPSEARILPGLWGEFRFAVPEAHDLLKDAPAGRVDSLLDNLKE